MFPDTTMEKQPETIGHLEQARHLAGLGFKLVVLRPGTKVPQYKGWQQAEYGEEEMGRLFDGTGLNVGIRTGGDLVVLDIDSTSVSDLEWVLENVGDTPMKVRSPRGGLHLYFRARHSVQYGNGVKLRGKPYDLRWQGCFIVCPWSETADGCYEWLGEPRPALELPFMKVSPLRERKRTQRRVQQVMEAPSGVEPSRSHIRNPELYCLTIDSIMGQNGSAGLVRVVCIFRDAGRSPQQAFDYVMGPWNAACAKPPWSETEVQHAIDRHYGLKG